MKCSVVFFFVCVAVAVADEWVEAEDCDLEKCKLPDCRCSSTSIPGGLLARDTPQFVTVSFDDAVNNLNILTYREVLYNRKNSNGCPAGATFYVNHEYTDYQFVNELYNQGYEIALHSISHQTPQDYWATASYDDLKLELADQKVQMAHFANIPMDNIKGVRLPFLQMNGNTSFQVMSDFGLVYDCSWTTNNFTDPGLWPYTLEYKSTQDCINPPCPSASIPKTWVLPMVSWSDLNGIKCAMADSCYFIPDLTDEDGWFQFILTNFERHYFGNRAPFGFYIHEWYLSINPSVKAAYKRFLDVINNLSDVFMVNSAEVIDWVKDPVPIDEYRTKSCKSWIPTICPANSCMLPSQHNHNTYWMSICNVCPKVYPWIGNPLGLEE